MGMSASSTSPNPKCVFVVHGRNLTARDGVFAFLRALGIQPIEWEQAVAMTREGSPYIGTVLDTALNVAQAIVVLLTPDEITYLRSEYAIGEHDPETVPSGQARPNVLFEAGMAMGRSAERTVSVEMGTVRPFSDVIGRHSVHLDNSPAKRKALAQRLKTAGCEVDMNGEDWLSAGDLMPPLPPGSGLPLGKKVPPIAGASRGYFDIHYHDLGRGNGRLQIINRSAETIYDINVVFPPEAGNVGVLADQLPLEKLPSGKSASLYASRTMGPGKNHFDVHVTGRTADGTKVEEDVFISLLG
jgi:predicted nucleotide-binding protein